MIRALSFNLEESVVPKIPHARFTPLWHTTANRAFPSDCVTPPERSFRPKSFHRTKRELFNFGDNKELSESLCLLEQFNSSPVDP